MPINHCALCTKVVYHPKLMKFSYDFRMFSDEKLHWLFSTQANALGACNIF